MAQEYRAKRHRDGGNLGPSAVKAFGPFRGGQLRIFPKDRGGGWLSGLKADVKIFLSLLKKYFMVEDYTVGTFTKKKC